MMTRCVSLPPPAALVAPTRGSDVGHELVGAAGEVDEARLDRMGSVANSAIWAMGRLLRFETAKIGASARATTGALAGHARIAQQRVTDAQAGLAIAIGVVGAREGGVARPRLEELGDRIVDARLIGADQRDGSGGDRFGARSVTSRITSTGLPSEGASSWILESVRMMWLRVIR